MAAGTYNLTVEQGVDLTLQVNVQDGTGATYSLAGSTAAAQIRDTYNGNLLASFSVVTNTGTPGVMALSLSATSAAALPLAKSYYDVKLVTSAGTTVRLVQGAVSVSGRVTL